VSALQEVPTAPNVEENFEQAESMMKKMKELDVLEAKMEAELESQQQHLQSILQEEEAIKLLLDKRRNNTATSTTLNDQLEQPAMYGVQQPVASASVCPAPAAFATFAVPAAGHSSTDFETIPIEPLATPVSAGFPALPAIK
jgi:hypothetical protein